MDITPDLTPCQESKTKVMSLFRQSKEIKKKGEKGIWPGATLDDYTHPVACVCLAVRLPVCFLSVHVCVHVLCTHTN